jgi:hypothetical protein
VKNDVPSNTVINKLISQKVVIVASSKIVINGVGLDTRVCSGHIDSVHLMRGIAALLVVVEHIIGRYGYAAFNSLLWFFDELGQVGVAGFFVISGIVLPLSLGKSFRWQRFPRFLLRRIVRIEFTYLDVTAKSQRLLLRTM